MTKAEKLVQIARTSLLLSEPFFGVLALALRYVEDPSCHTAWTNGTYLGFNPLFVLSLTPSELIGLIAHEVMHCACGHPWRRGQRDAMKWNIAADHAINHVLDEAHFELPAGALRDAPFKGKYAEWIYDRLPDNPKDNSNGNGSGNGSAAPGQFGEVRDAVAGADAPTESDWQQTVKQATASAKARGKLPASMAEAIDAAASNKTDWRSLLRRFVSEVAKADYRWSRPNPRYIAHGIYLPALRSEQMGALAIAIDTSGSIDTVLLAQFGAELQAIVDDLQPRETIVLYCDAKVHRVDRYSAHDRIELRATGRGGTSFVPVFDQLAHESDVPAALVYFTDLYGAFPDAAPEYPVLWASYGSNRAAPFGEVIPCE